VVKPGEGTDLGGAGAPRRRAQELALLSPFELKSELLARAEHAAGRTGGHVLDAGRGNPNWVATTPREALFLLGRFAVQEAKRAWAGVDLAGMIERAGIAERLRLFLSVHGTEPGAELLGGSLDYGVDRGFDPDAWAYELAGGVMGDHYPGPDRMLVHAEKVVHDYLVAEVSDELGAAGPFDLFAVEGGTAAMCYVFDSLATNLVLRHGDRVAIMVPAFTPYLEIPKLDRYGFDVVTVNASAVDGQGSHTWQAPDAELDKLADPSVKALFVINPSNPPSVMLAGESVSRLSAIVASANPDLVIVTDDVYGTFVDDFRSLLAELPRNVIGVYSFSKYFGCTGWRLGVVALHVDNVVDRLLTQLPAGDQQALNRRYRSLSVDPASIKFIDRMVADSRQVALNHTAGLSLPQQVQMTLFATFALIDTADDYKARTRSLLDARLERLYQALGVPLPDDPLRAGYYAEVDLLDWAHRRSGPDFASWLDAVHQPIDLLFQLADAHHVVLLHGGGFDGPRWSVRVSLANLRLEAYGEIGTALRTVFEGYLTEYQTEDLGRPTHRSSD